MDIASPQKCLNFQLLLIFTAIDCWFFKRCVAYFSLRKLFPISLFHAGEVTLIPDNIQLTFYFAFFYLHGGFHFKINDVFSLLNYAFIY